MPRLHRFGRRPWKRCFACIRSFNCQTNCKQDHGKMPHPAVCRRCRFSQKVTSDRVERRACSCARRPSGNLHHLQLQRLTPNQCIAKVCGEPRVALAQLQHWQIILATFLPGRAETGAIGHTDLNSSPSALAIGKSSLIVKQPRCIHI